MKHQNQTIVMPPFQTPADECRADGHKWEIVWSTYNLRHSLAMVVCSHCNEIGWQE